MINLKNQNGPDTTLSEIMRLRQQPTAYLLLAFLRHEYPNKPFFELPVEAIALRLCRTPRTIRTARDALLRSGDLTPYRFSPERPEGVRGRRPNLYTVKEQGSAVHAA